MTDKERLELNKQELIEEYKNLNKMPLTIEVSNRMSDIMLILVNKYGMDFDEVIALEDQHKFLCGGNKQGIGGEKQWNL